MDSQLHLQHDAAARRYEALDRPGGAVLGYLAYDVQGDGDLVLQHTIVAPENGGQGVATFLVEQVLSRAREEGRKIVPACSFVAEWLRQHPDDAAQQVRPDVRTRLGI